MHLSLGSIDIPRDKVIKLLGINIDQKLDFDYHISNICKRASFHVKAIQRLARYLDTEGLLRLFHAFIRSNFQYANIVWHFTSNSNVLKMEKNQRKSLRIVLSDYKSSYKDLLKKANTTSLYVSRIKAIAIETFKCIKKLNPKFLHDIFKTNDSGFDLRDGMILITPKV